MGQSKHTKGGLSNLQKNIAKFGIEGGYSAKGSTHWGHSQSRYMRRQRAREEARIKRKSLKK